MEKSKKNKQKKNIKKTQKKKQMEPSPWMGPPESMQKDLFLFWFLFCYYFFFDFFCFFFWGKIAIFGFRTCFLGAPSRDWVPFFLFFCFVFFVRENCNFWIPDMFSGGPIQGLGSICFCFVFFFFVFFLFIFCVFFLIFPFGPILDLFFWFVFFLFFNLFLDFGFVGGVSTVKTWNELSSMFQFSGFGFNSFLSCKKSTRLQGVTWRF